VKNAAKESIVKKCIEKKSILLKKKLLLTEKLEEKRKLKKDEGRVQVSLNSSLSAFSKAVKNCK
jgi:hypothetical protein